MSDQSSTATDKPGAWPKLRLNNLIPTFTSGLVVGLLETALAISLATLIFSGPLAQFRALGIGLALLGAILSSTVVALFTSLPGTMGGNQELPSVILSLVTADIILKSSSDTGPETLLITVLAAIALSTITTGLALFALGYFQLGNLVRFLPYPVVGGFLAATGWLLVSGSLSIMVPLPQDLAQFGLLLDPLILLRWLPGVLIGFTLLIFTRRSDNFLIMPGIFILAVLLFYGIAWGVGISFEHLQQEGWLLGPFDEGSLWRPFPIENLNLVDWGVLAEEVPHIAVIVLVSAIALLLNAGGVELASKQDIDFNRELRAAGAGNLFSGFVSGLIGFQQLGLSTMNFRVGSANRLTGLVGVLFCLLALLFGASLLSLVPQMVVAGMLFYLGLDFLMEWVVESRRTLPAIDYGVLMTILLATVFVGFIEAITLGLLLAVVLFVVGYSRVEIVRHEFSGKTFMSRVVRARHEEEFLTRQGECLYILQLQGFVFFGTADQLLNRVRHRLETDTRPPPKVVYLDFNRVTGLDSTGLLSFRRMKQLAAEVGATLVFIHPAEGIRRQLEKGGLGADGHRVRYFSSLDRGVQWGEERLLEEEENMSPESIWQQLKQMPARESDVDALAKYLQKMEVQEGQKLITYGQEAQDLFIVESGRVTAQIPRPDGPPLRLETIGGGHVVGEIGLYLGQKRTAEVVVDEPGVVYRLSAKDLQRMEQDDSEAAAALHRLIVYFLSERITRLTTVFDSLVE